MAHTRNHRPNKHSFDLPGACKGHQGQVIADLHDPKTGKFIRCAVVADYGDIESAKRYCEKVNANQMPAFRVHYEDGGSYVTSMAVGTTLKDAEEYFVGRRIEQADEKTMKLIVKVEEIE